MKSATIILNRNLPDVTDRLYESVARNNEGQTDIFVVESGSEKDKRSKYCTYWANWEESLESGLRYPRGFNYGLSKLFEEGRFRNYDYFFLLCNDSVFEDKPIISTLVREMERHPRVGILSPCSDEWGERKLLKADDTKYFWYINHIAWFVRREYIESIMETDKPTYMNFLYDGENFRGYESDIELVVKGYANDWAAAITTKVKVVENEDLLHKRFQVMKTDEFGVNRQKLVIEGKRWLRRKYGFNSRWTLQMYAKFFYERFFEYFPQLGTYKL